LYHIHAACDILSTRYSRVIDFNYSEKDIEIYPERIIPLERFISSEKLFYENIPLLEIRRGNDQKRKNSQYQDKKCRGYRGR